MGQRPFIMNASLRDNVTFGLPFELEKYRRTLQMCALGPDLDVLPSGKYTSNLALCMVSFNLILYHLY